MVQRCSTCGGVTAAVCGVGATDTRFAGVRVMRGGARSGMARPLRVPGSMATHVFPIDTLSARAWRLDALLLDRVRLRAWDRLLFIECGDGWLAEEASRRIGRGWVCGLSASNRLVDRAT